MKLFNGFPAHYNEVTEIKSITKLHDEREKNLDVKTQRGTTVFSNLASFICMPGGYRIKKPAFKNTAGSGKVCNINSIPCPVFSYGFLSVFTINKQIPCHNETVQPSVKE